MSQTPQRNQSSAKPHARFNRRTLLRGLGACLALPALESLVPARLLTAPAGAAAATTAGGAPLRTAFIYIPNGVIQDTWWPTGEGAEFELGRTMEPLAGLKSRIQVLGGLDHVHATAGPDGPGDHAR